MEFKKDGTLIQSGSWGKNQSDTTISGKWWLDDGNLLKTSFLLENQQIGNLFKDIEIRSSIKALDDSILIIDFSPTKKGIIVSGFEKYKKYD